MNKHFINRGIIKPQDRNDDKAFYIFALVFIGYLIWQCVRVSPW